MHANAGLFQRFAYFVCVALVLLADWNYRHLRR